MILFRFRERKEEGKLLRKRVPPAQHHAREWNLSQKWDFTIFSV